MTRWLLAALTAGLLAAAPGLARADEPKEPVNPPKETPREPIPPPKDFELPPPIIPDGCAPGCGRQLCAPQFHLMELLAATTLPRMRLRDEVVGLERRMVVAYQEERRVVNDVSLKPHEVEQEVTCIDQQPCQVTDPCTGHCHTEYHPVPVVKKVKVTVYEAVPTTREVLVRVPYLKPGPEFQVRRLAVDCITIPAIEKRLQLIETDNVITAPVPPPLPPCPGPSCPESCPGK
jgi:hypothetical protein